MEIDLNALQQAVGQEIDKLSADDVRKQLLDLRVREKTTQKKQYGSDAAKRSAAKQREKSRALKARAKALGIYDSVDEEAEKAAEADFSKWKADQASKEAAGEVTEEVEA